MKRMHWLAIAGVLSIVVMAVTTATGESGGQTPVSPCRGVLSREFATRFAAEWIAAWNSHDLTRILAHYADDFEMFSPLIIERVGEASGVLRGKEKVGAYWKIGLAASPPLRFELIDVYAGVSSLTIHYRSVGRRIAAEVLEFDAQCRVVRGRAHHGGPA